MTADHDSPGIHVDCAGRTHCGLVRENNEDCFLVGRVGRFHETRHTNIPGVIPLFLQETGYGMVVTDGMGGAAGGELASELAIQTLFNLALETPDWIFSDAPSQGERIMERMAYRYRRIDLLLREQGRTHDELAGMGTTMTLACSIGRSLLLTHVGDSRAYLFRAGRLQQLTQDHTVVQRLMDHGLIEREDQISEQLRHTLTNVLGGTGKPCSVDVRRIVLADQDKVLLCTDGLTGMVDEAAIANILTAAAPADATCAALIDATLAAGGKDNVTVALAQYRFA